MATRLQIDPLAASLLSESAIQKMRQRTRILQMMDTVERVAISPIRTRRLHGFAYLADVLSPVWNLPAFDGTVLKIAGGPYYPDFQRELDQLVIAGLIEISDIQYNRQTDGGARIDAAYSLNLAAPALSPILDALGARDGALALDPMDYDVYRFLLDLAGALTTVPDEEIDKAASVDATYADDRVDQTNVIDFGRWTTNARVDNLSVRTVDRFQHFLPSEALLSGGEKLYLYASFLGRRVHGQ